MTGSNDTPQRLTLVAIDIARHYHDVPIEPPVPKRRSRLRLANRREDFEQLAQYLQSLKSSVIIGLKQPATIIGRWRTFSTARAFNSG
jgi:hypothetical protein